MLRLFAVNVKSSPLVVSYICLNILNSLSRVILIPPFFGGRRIHVNVAFEIYKASASWILRSAQEDTTKH